MSAIAGLLSLGSPNDTANSKRLMRDTVVEFVATTFFIFAGTLSASSTAMKLVGMGDQVDVARTLPIAFVFGVTIMVMAYSIGHLSGGHMNPAVSFMMFLRRQLSFTKMLCYWLAQFLGALLGSTITWGCISNLAGQNKYDGIDATEFNRPPFNLGSNSLDGSLSSGNGLLLEFMGSAFFFFVIAQTALDKRGIADTAFPAIPIGFSLVVVHVCLIPFTGCGVNPARTFGPSMVTCMAGGPCDEVASKEWWWIYYVGPFLAAWFVAELTLLLEMDVGDDEDNSEVISSPESTQPLKSVEEIQPAPTAEEATPPSVEVGV